VRGPLLQLPRALVDVDARRQVNERRKRPGCAFVSIHLVEEQWQNYFRVGDDSLTTFIERIALYASTEVNFLRRVSKEREWFLERG
jgi:hypothetical protein